MKFHDNDCTEYMIPVEISDRQLHIALLEHGINYRGKKQQVRNKYKEIVEHVKGVRGDNPRIRLIEGVSHYCRKRHEVRDKLDFSIHMHAFPERLPELWREEYANDVIGYYSCLTTKELNYYISNGQANKLFEFLDPDADQMKNVMTSLSEYTMLLLLEEAVAQVCREDENEIILLKNHYREYHNKFTEIDALLLFWRPTNLVRILKVMKALTKEIDVYYKEELGRD